MCNLLGGAVRCFALPPISKLFFLFLRKSFKIVLQTRRILCEVPNVAAINANKFSGICTFQLCLDPNRLTKEIRLHIDRYTYLHKIREKGRERKSARVREKEREREHVCNGYLHHHG